MPAIIKFPCFISAELFWVAPIDRNLNQNQVFKKPLTLTGFPGPAKHLFTAN